MSERGKKPGLVRQGNVMIPQAETPVLHLPEDILSPPSWAIASAVNFLRCSCSAVQLIGDKWPEEAEGKRAFLDDLQDVLVELQRPGERFGIESKGDEASWPAGTIVTVTRIVGES